jgi:hypothetical protein
VDKESTNEAPNKPWATSFEVVIVVLALLFSVYLYCFALQGIEAGFAGIIDPNNGKPIELPLITKFLIYQKSFTSLVPLFIAFILIIHYRINRKRKAYS